MDSSPCRRRRDCRLCAATDLERVLQLAPTPPANAFVAPDQLEVEQQRFPLDVWLCAACGHTQLLDVVDAGQLFSDYVYVSGTSPTFVAHFQRYAGAVSAAAGLAPGDLVVDIGSNDGTLLRFFADGGQRVLGIDPAEKIARQATAGGIETLPAFFSVALARQIRGERGPARAVTANNVFAHVDDLDGVVEGVRALLADDGLFFFEVSYLLDVVDKLLFDTIYHEHLDYHSVTPLVPFFRKHGMELVDVERVDTHGGSIRGVARLAAGGPAVSPRVAELVALEGKRQLGEAAPFRELAARIAQRRDALRGLLAELRGAGKRIAGFGAPAKATTLMYELGLGRDALEFIADDSPLKQHLFTPGLHVPVLPSSAIEERRPDYLLVLAWNFAAAIVAKHPQFSKAGGHFIVPLPELEVI